MPGRASSAITGVDWPAAARPPVFLTGLVGRAEAVEQVVAVLRTARLLSLVGPGGTGKTRLAAAVVADLVAKDTCDVAWIDLASLMDPELVARHVASTLALREHPGRGAEEALVERIAESRSLLVLDNCEHVVAACARLTATLLRACSALRIVVTSREPLGVAGEKAWRVPPLELPAVDDHTARESAAVELFVQRASDVLPSFTVTPANLPAIARICRRLDGLPLAIELAAARVPLLPPNQLAVMLDDMFRVLGSRSSTLPERHRTLRGLIDWSYALLSPAERDLFDRLAVFVGGFTLTAAEQVAGGTGDDVLARLAALVDKSLVVMREEQGGARYTMLETVRQYAVEKLPVEVHLAHARYYTGLVEQLAAPARLGSPAWWAPIDAEHDNVRAALAWTLGHTRVELALRLCVGMREFWRLRGFHSEALNATRSALDAAREHDEAGQTELERWRARALVAASVQARMTGEFTSLQGWLAEAECTARAANDRATLADALTQLGLSLRDRGDLAAARERLDEALSLWRAIGAARCLGTALGARASIGLADGDVHLARSLRLEAAEAAHLAGDREAEAHAQIGLGEVARMSGDLDERLWRVRQDLSGRRQSLRADALPLRLCPAPAPDRRRRCGGRGPRGSYGPRAPCRRAARGARRHCRLRGDSRRHRNAALRRCTGARLRPWHGHEPHRGARVGSATAAAGPACLRAGMHRSRHRRRICGGRGSRDRRSCY